MNTGMRRLVALAGRKGLVRASFCVSPPTGLQIKNDRNIILISAKRHPRGPIVCIKAGLQPVESHPLQH